MKILRTGAALLVSATLACGDDTGSEPTCESVEVPHEESVTAEWNGTPVLRFDLTQAVTTFTPANCQPEQPEVVSVIVTNISSMTLQLDYQVQGLDGAGAVAWSVQGGGRFEPGEEKGPYSSGQASHPRVDDGEIIASVDAVSEVP